MLFVFLLFWYVGFVIAGRFPRQTQETNTKATQIQHTKKQLNTKKNNKNKTGPAFPVELCFFVFWSRSSGGSTDTFGGLKRDPTEKARTRRWER